MKHIDPATAGARFVVIDLEATCWEKGTTPMKMEIIEVGAVALDAAYLPTGEEFDMFVRPSLSPVLSEFCTRLTSIAQEDVDGAAPFPVVLEAFENWLGRGRPVVWCSWGAYDLKQFMNDCRRHRMRPPRWLQKHVNLKREFASLTDGKRRTMKEALSLLCMPLIGRHHRGIDDARNIAALASWILPRTLLEVRAGERVRSE